MTDKTEPTTEAGRRLGVDVERELGVQFKSADMYRGWLATANALALAIEAEAAAEQAHRWAIDIMRVHDAALAEGRAIEAEARATVPDDGLVAVRKDSGGVFPDGTTNTPAIDFDARPAAEPPALDVEHEGEHDFDMTCRKCGKRGMVHLSVITADESVVVARLAREGSDECLACGYSEAAHEATSEHSYIAREGSDD